MTRPIVYKWTEVHDADGEVLSAMVPNRHFKERCSKLFTPGESYILFAEEGDERSAEEHNHYFAQLHEAWLNLPENISDQFQNETHFRKWLLIKCGYYNESKLACGSHAAAIEAAAALAANPDIAKQYPVILVDGTVTTLLTAKSQRMGKNGGMFRKEFQQSKIDVLDTAAAMVGVKREELRRTHA